jgi:hypothetical protein
MEANQNTTNTNEKKTYCQQKTNNVTDLINAWLGNGVMNTF